MIFPSSSSSVVAINLIFALLLLSTATATTATPLHHLPASSNIRQQLVAAGKTSPFLLKGFSSGPDDAHGVDLMANKGHANVVRRYIMWKNVEPELHNLDHGLTIEKMKSDPKRHIYDWADSVANWHWSDVQVRKLAEHNRKVEQENAGGKIKAILECSEGTHYGLPKYNGTLADPAIIGMELYLAYQYRLCRAAARRYNLDANNTLFADGITNIWQIENELNEAFLASVQGQRLLTFPHSPWANWTFLTRLLHVLKDAIHSENPSAKLTMNFHTDIPKIIHQQLNLPGYYEDAVRDWASSLLDIVSFDAYPCYYVADAEFGAKVIANRTRNILEASKSSGSNSSNTTATNNNSKAVFVMETGFPVNAPDANPANMTKFPNFNFTEENQALYATLVGQAIRNHGGSGFLYFKLQPQKGMPLPSGGYTNEDESMFQAIKLFLETDNELALIEWLFGNDGRNLWEALTRASKFLGRPSLGWGLQKEDGTPRPAFHALARFFENV